MARHPCKGSILLAMVGKGLYILHGWRENCRQMEGQEQKFLEKRDKKAFDVFREEGAGNIYIVNNL